ncbi:MAG: hypothetical protein ACNA7W_13710 [Pseudomonadales bacterium]
MSAPWAGAPCILAGRGAVANLDQRLELELPMHEVIPFGDSVSASAAPSPVRSDDELVKWRERVPKLAAALRQRTEEVQQLQADLQRLQQAPPAGAAGIRARDDLIRELEAKAAALAEQHKGAQGELHKRQLVIDELRADLDAWKEKWQALTRSLDEQALEVRARDERVAMLERDSAALRARNAQLLETTELANRQIGSLTDSMVELRQMLQQQREVAAEYDRASRDHALRAEELQAALQAAEAGREAAEAGREAAEALLPELMEDLQVAYAGALAAVGAAADAAAFSAAVEARQDAEIRLAAAATQRAAALQQVRSLEQRIGQLETQLEERSALVVTVEQDQRQGAERLQQLQRERDQFEEAVLRAERHARESSAHVSQLGDKLERQQQLMVDLERELAEANQRVQAQQARETDGAHQAEALRVQVRKLEALVRERTEALNQLQWQQQMAAAPATEQSGRSAAGKAAAGAAADGKLLLVLNQQLEAARSENAELLGRVRALQADRSGDDLTKIRGIGRKFAAQLNGLGIHRYQQIAELDDDALADRQHPLHPHRARVLRDRWIEQAVGLIGT